MERYQKALIERDLEKKMVLLAGPRQAGKTTLAKQIAKKFPRAIYLNYDSFNDRKIIMKESWLPTTDLLILDEIHKMNEWKNYLKGLYDTKPSTLRVLVTGSARLDIFRQAGDSLAGRYFLHHLLPLSPAEFSKLHEKSDLERFLERGGFPEPYLADNVIDAKRWQLQYIDSLLREDVLDYENIHNVRSMQLVFELLRSRVGSPVSFKAIAQDTQLSPNTVRKYIEIFEALYIVFRVIPYSNNIARSLLKEPKIYFFDSSLVKNGEGAKLENLVATCLLKHVFAKIDYHAESYALHYLRTKEKHEVDFALVLDGKVKQAIEVKSSSENTTLSTRYFNQKYGIPTVQIIKNLKHERIEQNIELHDAHKFLIDLEL